MLDLSNVTKNYTGKTVVVSALNNVNLKIAAGEFVAIMGPSGCGKTTMLNILGLLDRPTSGNYLLAGVDTGQLGADTLAKERNNTIGFIFQSFELLGQMTALENVCLPLEYSAVPKRERREKALKALSLAGIKHLADKIPSTLSGGEQQRVAIARAIVNEPSVILADEPTGNLDRQTGRNIMGLLKQLSKEINTTIVLVTHDPLVASYAERIVQMVDGAVISDAPVRKKLLTSGFSDTEEDE